MKPSGRHDHSGEPESIEFVPKRELDRAQQEIERLRKQSERLRKENERLRKENDRLQQETERLRRELEAALRVGWRKIMDRWLFSYDEPQFRDKIHNEPSVRTQRLMKSVAPFAQFLFALTQ